MTTTQQAFPSISASGISVSNIVVTETDGTGVLLSFLRSTPPSESIFQPDPSSFVEFQFAQGVADRGPDASITLVFEYDVSATSAGYGINALQQSFTTNLSTPTPAGITITGF